ncbi:hypothetical protein SAMN04488552_0456 [Christiangramia echinicola]|uniref:Glycosyl transferases group 1 n=1 Tax=Christiangramia echinicola TaxID=279359 RepID=A0A1H1L202_9FLAO|nr:hypothetical protein SAMN04488552_0456 [Christiangramia echinicola]
MIYYFSYPSRYCVITSNLTKCTKLLNSNIYRRSRPVNCFYVCINYIHLRHLIEVMISSKLKRFFYAKKIRKVLKNKPLLDIESLDKIGFITDAESFKNNDEFLNLHKQLEHKKADLKIVVCGSGIDLDRLQVEVLDPKEVTFSGEFKSAGIQNFIQEHYDFIICYFSENNLLGSLLAAEAYGRVKIGNKPDDYGIYDVEINSGNKEEFLEEVIKYYRIFKKKN